MQTNNDFINASIANGTVAAVKELMSNPKFKEIASGIGQNLWNSVFKGLENDLDVRDAFICKLSEYTELHAVFIGAEAFPRFSVKSDFSIGCIKAEDINKLSKLDKRFWTERIGSCSYPWLNWYACRDADIFREIIKLFTVEELDAYVYHNQTLLERATTTQYRDLLEKGVTNANPSRLTESNRKLLEEKLKAKQLKQSLDTALKTILGDEFGALVFKQVSELMK